jgi:hypothetical protein
MEAFNPNFMSKLFNAKRFEIFIIVVVIAAIGVVYAFTRKPVNAPTTSTTQTAQNQSVSYEGQDGRNALDLLKVFHDVETKDTAYGAQVMGIDGNHPDESNSYWAFYVNGKLADKGADQYVTKNGDQIEWKVEKF